MPKAWSVDELKPEMPLSEAAALILQVKLPELFHAEKGVLRGGVEPVHDMRIGSKRLREAVRVLKPAIPARDRKRVLSTVEQLNDLLGEVRDRDVLREALVALGKDDPAAALPPKLLGQLKRERREHHALFVQFIGEFHSSDFEDFYARLMKRMLRAKGDQETVAVFAAAAVSERLQSVVDNMEVIYKPSTVPAFHRQRIRVKKLKYALEPFLTILPPSLKPTYDLIGNLQELMGQVHDIDVQAELLGQWWEEHEEQTTALEAALGTLQERREKLLKATVAHARKMQKAKFDKKLREALAQPL